jgi:hypothetical protein
MVSETNPLGIKSLKAPAAMEALSEQLTAALREDEPEAPADPARQRLAVARASTAR